MEQILETSDGVVGAAGQFIAAVMETAGLYAQSQVLENFSPFFQSLGALLYMMAALSAILSVALYGNYRMGAYLILAPAIFWWILTATNPVTSTAHGVTNDANSQEQIGFLSYAGDPKRYRDAKDLNRYKHAEVSEFFIYYDNLISNIIQTVSSFLVDMQKREDLLFVARERVMTRVLQNRVEDKNFLRLLSRGLMGNCAKAIALKKDISSPRLQNTTPEDPEYASKIKEREDKEARYQALIKELVPLEGDLRVYVTSLGFSPGDNVTCKDVWDYTKQACLLKAKEDLKPQERELALDEDKNVNWDNVYEEVKKKLVGNDEKDLTKAFEILAAYYLKNSIANTAHGAMLNNLSNKEPMHGRMQRNIFGNIAGHESNGGRMIITYFAGSVPYIQGVLLYILTAAFPFFSFCLLLPGRISGFFVWMSLWLWVKSWDVGFAFVHFMRDIFWDSMPHAGEVRTDANWGTFEDLDWADPSSVFNLIYLNDPTSSLNTYYSIIALLTLSVPALTAHLCMGATDLYNALKLSINGQAERWGPDVVKGHRRNEATIKHAALEYNEAKAAEAAALKAYQNLGQTSDGVSRASTGDGAPARYARGEADKKAFDYGFGAEQRELANDRAALEGRRMSWRKGTSQLGILAEGNKEREQYEARSAVSGSHIPGIASEKADNTNTTYQHPPKTKPFTGGESD
ncbi:MAG: hypothetical protein IT291_05275 [Deltaproteobacteria bacterium]|nr:hypothetical protein [Deltaproteobacteria bacterium]